MNLEPIPAGVEAEELCPRGICQRCDGAWNTLAVAYAIAQVASQPIERSGANATLGAFTGVGD